MDMLFFLLSIACLVVLVIGLAKPAKVIKWGGEEKKTRKNVAKYYGIGFLVCFVLFVVNAGNTGTNSTANKGNTPNTENTSSNSTTKAGSDKDKATEVDTLIAGLGDTNAITLNSSAKVGAARTAYDKLTDNQKALVTKLDTLKAAENQIYVLTKATAEKATAEKAAADKAAAMPTEYKSALRTASSYANTMHMAKKAVYDQLVSEYGEKFTKEAAQYAIDNVKADWKANALATAKSYQNSMAMSPARIRDQLVSEYGEKFTAEEADYAIHRLND